MKEKEATKVILYFGQVEGLEVKNQEIKRLEPSFLFWNATRRESRKGRVAILRDFHHKS